MREWSNYLKSVYFYQKPLKIDYVIYKGSLNLKKFHLASINHFGDKAWEVAGRHCAPTSRKSGLIWLDVSEPYVAMREWKMSIDCFKILEL